MVFHHASPVKSERCRDEVFPLEIPQELSGGAWTSESWAWEGPLGFLGTAPSGRGVTVQDGWPRAGQ